ncbi:ribosomal protein S18 acetylase RimI-like enzyme [Novosphingobium sp. PhB165]|uniref:GNAT family N-acetyltransferase n=1 Tax=Novosphingobium sp. PhB165 TaxID=2485105 RepID=UPI0010510233|nr:GNAT family N-acetyltransferase [Novosphingobium sp. PhB165]TCM19030.1 ribosomal protein S18 acetylase RimI-like enzyme [Novosphingobium sp. PhB165]
MEIRVAVASDLPALHPVIERAYRGDSARAGWTFESDLLDGERTDLEELTAVLESPADRLLVALSDEGAPIGCVQVTDRGEGLSYLGLLCIDPVLQAGGLGRMLIAAAESLARDVFGARAMEMTVIDKRSELIAYYERRGYALTGEKRAFPIVLDPPLGMVVLEKPLLPANVSG